MQSVKEYYIKTERYDWVEVTDHFKGVESIFHWNRMRVILKLAKKYRRSVPLIDVGCGTGLILRNLPLKSIGLDINPWAIEKAKKHAPNAELIIADAENMPFKGGSVNTIVCAETLEHLPCPELALKEVYRVLSQGGSLVGSVPHNTVFWKFRILSSTCPHEEPFHNQYKVKKVVRLLKSFKIVYMKISTLRLNIVFVAMKSYFN